MNTIKCTVDFGNVWDMLSAIGTTMAVIISLWSSKRKKRIHLTAFDKTYYSGYKIDYSIENTGNVPIVITRIGLKKRGKTLDKIDLHQKDYLTIYPGQCYTDSVIFMNDTVNKNSNEDLGNVYLYVRDISNESFKTKKKIHFENIWLSKFDSEGRQNYDIK